MATQCLHAEEHPSDEDLTPHPFNPLIPIEINTPVTWAIDPSDFVATLAHGFYDRPSERLTTVGVTGTNGKTTVAWLMRSIFEQLGQLTGMIGTVEYSIATDRLDIEGDLWEPFEEDTTLSRECSTPFWGAPYEGKYEVPCTTPDNVSVRLQPCLFLVRHCWHIHAQSLANAFMQPGCHCIRILLCNRAHELTVPHAQRSGSWQSPQLEAYMSIITLAASHTWRSWRA